VIDAGPEWQRRDPAAILERNRALFALEDYAKVKAGIIQGLALQRTPGLLVQQAMLAIAEKRYDSARASAQEALTLNPNSVEALGLIARSYLLQGNLARARSVMDSYAAAHPGSAEVQAYVGEWLGLHGFDKEGHVLLTRSLAMNPSFLAPKVTLAQLDAKNGNTEAARASLSDVVKLSPRNEMALTSLAELEVRSGRKSQAIEYYRQLVQINRRNESALNNLAFLLMDSNPDEALDYAQLAKEVAPNSPSVDDTLGWVLYKKGIYNTAVRHLEFAARNGAALHSYHLAMAYAKVGDHSRGKQALAAGLTANQNLPEAALAKRALAELRP
jgi:tetratricopeptide (TPR) repeat protein